MTTLKYFAQKTNDGYPIPSTMMGFKQAPTADTLVEILPQNYEVEVGESVKPSDSGLRYFVRHDKKGNIIPNSLITSKVKPKGLVYEFKIITGIAIIAPFEFEYATLPGAPEVGTAVSYSPSFAVAPTGTISYSAIDLPTGLSINTTTGVISGTPTVAAESKTATITVTNETGSYNTTWEYITEDLV